MNYYDNFGEFCGAMEGDGAFLVVEDKKGRVNVMTIGWAQAGVIWGVPILTVLVRPSRHTHSMLESVWHSSVSVPYGESSLPLAGLENAAHFSVCVPRGGGMKKELAFCGTKSGREYDKVRACALKLKEGAVKGLKYLEGCRLVYQCELYGRTDLRRETLAPAALEKYYPGHDAPHTLYFGKILKAENF